MSNSQGTIDFLKHEKIIAIIRLKASDSVVPIVEALLAGGVHAIEVTITTPGALGMISELAKRNLDHLCLGVGSVVEPDMVARCADAGAKYIVTPAINEGVVEEGFKRDLPVLAGAFTPTEVLRSYQLGCQLIKVFPAEFLGPTYIKALKAPMPYVELVPTGGVSLSNAQAWFDNGAAAVGVGGSLLSGYREADRNYAQVTKNAQAFRAALTDH